MTNIHLWELEITHWLTVGLLGVNWLKVAFWLCAYCVVYTYILYPICTAYFAKVLNRKPVGVGKFAGTVSIIIPAHNEEAYIVRRIHEFTLALASTGLDGEIIIVSDGSTDRTVELAREHANEYVQVLELTQNVGKAGALARAKHIARGDVIVLADARQHWAHDALENLLQNFTDPSVGGASGDLIIETSDGMMAGVGSYWRYEKWIRRNESKIHSTVGVTGAISAVRRELFPAIPVGTLLDDVYWPMQLVLAGHRVVHDETAIAYDRLPEKVGDEFKRKLRTLAGNFQLLMLMPSLLAPWRNPAWVQFMSHKIMRLIVPWALIVLLLVSAQLSEPIYRLAMFAQLSFYLIGVIGIVKEGQTRIPLASAAGSFSS
jgi:cellulose synthase/poly-beta-1,6-N-acetylglucosamine synthase-like glycosyltransferase